MSEAARTPSSSARPSSTAARRRRVTPARRARPGARWPAARRAPTAPATRRPPWRSTMSAAIASPRPRRPRPARGRRVELADRRRQARALVGDLDADPVALTAPARARRARAPCSNALATQVADRLRQPHAVAAHARVRGPGATTSSSQPNAGATGAPRAPLARRCRSPMSTGSSRSAAPRAARRRGEVVERERRPGAARGRSRPRPRARRRSAQLGRAAVSGPRSSWQRARDELAPATQLAPQTQRDAGGGHAAAAGSATQSTCRRRRGERRSWVDAHRPVDQPVADAPHVHDVAVAVARRACGAGGRRASPACASSPVRGSPRRAQQLLLREDARRLARRARAAARTPSATARRAPPRSRTLRARRVDLERRRPAGARARRRRSARRSSAAHARAQLGVAERLADVVVGAALEAAHAVELAARPLSTSERQRRGRSGWRRRRRRARARSRSRPDAVGQAEVDDREVGEAASPAAQRRRGALSATSSS